ncbi:hypothetical protein SPRG_02530 [Saprolegnia parasitica CBS 223.65]|uniref:Uncharacterized protein n=1 Tax=Saprolegnia parasitica (strain CBS 223.65) TaxID=695850 RepID=A0A067D1C7_SAPPC|nr:hypothetical protein SPRG_02530 [Saprolegnia parasitica CBS 223.65]KDO32837.1 hypothetical protein SPRG_02530 [Saprolegnia parasitica CBS 223.65]|eukprot:XP_012196492.1 hypothetical protein SPRG_02530 [Saprolegnia parasitica CBS 223.65]
MPTSSSTTTTAATRGGTPAILSQYLVAAYKELLSAAHTKFFEAESAHTTAQQQLAQRLLDSEAARRVLERERDVEDMAAQNVEMAKLCRGHEEMTALAARVSSLEGELRAATLASQQKTSALEITLAKLLDDNIVRTALKDMNDDMLSQISALEQQVLAMEARHSQDNFATLKAVLGLDMTDGELQTKVHVMSSEMAAMRYELVKLTSKQALRDGNQRRSK